MSLKSVFLEHPDLVLRVGCTLLIAAVARVIWILNFSENIIKEWENSFVTSPFRIRLIPATDAPSAPTAEVQALVEPLLKAGFADAGAFRIWEIPAAKLQLLIQPETRVAACVYRLNGLTTLDLVSSFEDGTTLDVCNAKLGGEFSRPEQQPAKRYPEAGAAELYERMLAERGDRPLRPVRIETAAEELQARYAAQQDWLAERGGYTSDEIRREILASGKKADEHAVQYFRERLAAAALKNWWRAQPGAALPWEEVKDCLVVIHNDLKVDDIEYIYADNSGDWETELKSLPKPITSARQAFALLNQAGGGLYEKIAEKTTPLAADFYLLRADGELQQEAA